MSTETDDDYVITSDGSRVQIEPDTDGSQRIAAQSSSTALEESGFADTDIANARRFADQHRENVRFTPERGWFVWDGRKWAWDEQDLQVQEFAKRTALSVFDEVKKAKDRDALFKHAKASQSRKAIQSMLSLARSEPGIPMKVTEFDRAPWLINVSNGTVNLHTGTLQPHSRADLISNISEVEFSPGSTCELWHAFLNRVTDGNQELCNYLRRFVGYLLVADTSDQSIHFLHGMGANGKTVFCEVLMRLLGDYALAASPDIIMLKRHSGIPNDVARLRGVRAAFMNETAQGSKFNEAKLKDLTGGDTLTARFMREEFFDFKPSHRIIIRGNHKPTISGTDDGIWRRLRLVPFTVAIPADEQDRNLLVKLQAELPGILQWAIAGCAEWQRDGLNPPPVVVEAGRRYRDESDTLGRFIEDCCSVQPLAQVASGALYNAYKKFAEAAGERAMTAKDFPNELEHRGFERKKLKAGMVFLGLELTPGEA
jgi:putative DNA primase/helicase